MGTNFSEAYSRSSNFQVVIFSPPVVRDAPVGYEISLEDLCRSAGIRMRLSIGKARPIIKLHRQGQNILAISAPGKAFYCVDIHGYPECAKKRSEMILQCLAYGFRDWGAREILKQEKSIRHLEQLAVSKIPSTDDLQIYRRKASSHVNLALLASIRNHPGKPLSWHASALGMALSNVSRGARLLERAQWVKLVRQGNCTMAEPLGEE